MPTVSSLRGEITLDSSGYKRGLDQAKQATQQFTSESVRASGEMRQLTDQMLRQREAMQRRVEVQRQALVEDSRAKDVSRQRIALERELLAETSRLSRVLQEEGQIAQQVAAKFSLVSEAEQRRLVIVKEQIAARAATSRAEEQAAAAAERASAREIAATERAAAAAERAARRRFSAANIGQGLASAGRSLSLGVTAPILGLAAGGVKLFGDMEENLNVLQQISGATNDQMKQLGDQAIALGGDMKLPATSAADAARAMIELKQAGLSVDEVMKAARPTLVLTAATGLNVAESARLAASTMNAFALPPARLTHIMDMLVAAQSAAGVKMREITPAIRQASAAFRTAGQSPESLITALAVLSKAGVRGELAGTGLRNMLVNLAKDTPKVTAAMKALGVQAFDPITKQMKPLRTLIDEMSRSLEKFTPQVRSNLLNSIFGGRSQGANILFRGVGQWDEMADKIQKEGAAAAAAEARNKGLKGAIDALNSALSTALIQGITPIKDDLNVFARRIGEVAKAFADLPAPVRRSIVEWLAFAAVLGPVLGLLGNLTKGFALVKGALEAMKAEAFLAQLAIGGPWLAAAVISAGLLYAAWDKPFMVNVRKGVAKFGDALSNLVTQAKGNFHQLASLWADAQSKLGLDKPGPSLTGMPNPGAERAKRIRDTVAGLGPNALDVKLFGGSAMEDAAARARQVVGTRAPSLQSSLGATAGAAAGRGTLAVPGASTFDPKAETDAMRLQKRAAEELADSTFKLNLMKKGMNEQDATFLTQHREMGMLTAQRLLHIQHETEAINKQRDAQKKANEEAERARKAARAEIERQTQAAEKHIRDLNARGKDLQRQINEGGAVGHGVAAQVLHPKADPAVRALEQEAVARTDALTTRLAALNKARHEARAAEEALRKLWAGPAKVADDPQLNALHARTAAATEAADRIRKYHADEKKAHEEGDKAFEEEARKRLHFGKLLLEQQQKEQEELFALGGSTRMPKDALEALRMQAEKLRHELHNDEGFANFDQGMKNLTASLHRSENAAQKFARSFSEAFQQQFEGLFTHLMEHGFKGFWRSVVQGFTQMLQQIAAQILAAKLTDLIFGGTNADTGQRAGGLIDVIAKVFGGGKAAGGPVSAGHPYMVGERGRELFVPRSSGAIVSNNQLAAAGAGGGGVHITVHVAGEQLPNARRNASAMAQQIGRELNRQQRRNGNG